MSDPLDHLKKEIEHRELVALQRTVGTDIRKATLERLALTAGYHFQVADQCLERATDLIERIRRLLPQEEAILFLTAITADKEEIKSKAGIAGVISLVSKLIAAPFIFSDIKSIYYESLEPIQAANRMKNELKAERIDVGDPIPVPVFREGIRDQIAALKLLIDGLIKARAFFKWLESFKK